MTINSNKTEKTVLFKGLRKWFKDTWKTYGIFPYIMTVVVGIVLILSINEENQKQMDRDKKVAFVKANHPTLIYEENLFFDEQIITDYKLVKMDNEYKVDILKDGKHFDYILLYKVKAIEVID